MITIASSTFIVSSIGAYNSWLNRHYQYFDIVISKNKVEEYKKYKIAMKLGHTESSNRDTESKEGIT